MYKCTAIIKASQNFIVIISLRKFNLERAELPTTEFTAFYTNTCAVGSRLPANPLLGSFYERGIDACHLT